ncbi:MAG: hypothetical protein CMH53_00520, partial [Myxococcales bacterium]|nr:hypothetical protein [Myxococcales bacterium]
MPKHRTIVWILALGAMACSAPKAERLRDDPASSKAWTQKSVHTPAVADAINRFNQAILSEQLHIAYALLSRATRRALEERARPHGLRGVDLLASGQKDSINPIETFTAPNIQSVSYSSARKDEIKLVFDQDLKWDEEIIERFYLDDSSAKVT